MQHKIFYKQKKHGENKIMEAAQETLNLFYSMSTSIQLILSLAVFNTHFTRDVIFYIYLDYYFKCMFLK